MPVNYLSDSAQSILPQLPCSSSLVLHPLSNFRLGLVRSKLGVQLGLQRDRIVQAAEANTVTLDLHLVGALVHTHVRPNTLSTVIHVDLCRVLVTWLVDSPSHHIHHGSPASLTRGLSLAPLLSRVSYSPQPGR